MVNACNKVLNENLYKITCCVITKTYEIRANEMVQWVKMLAATPDNVNSSTRPTW